MAECCAVKDREKSFDCPNCENGGKNVEIITLKSLLAPDALAKLNPEGNYRMCIDETCDTVYYNQEGQEYRTEDIKVPVFQKTDSEDCPVCYCFGWTRKKIKEELKATGKTTALESIKKHIQEGRCGCKANNPQGSCCLENVKKVIEEFDRDNK